MATKKKKDTVTLKYDLERWGSYNQPGNNERKVELPIGTWFLDKFNHDVVEIGEVTNSHIPVTHTVYDLRNEMPGTIVQDARELDYKKKNVLSISTVEHVGEGDLELIQRIQKESKNHLITFPVGFNRELEAKLVESGIEYSVIVRSTDALNTWKQTDNKDLSLYNYNNPFYAGNAIVVITNLNVEFVFED